MNSFFKWNNRLVFFDSRITITGSTKNIEGHAVVVSEHMCVYYVDGLNEWEQNWLNATVKISGNLERSGNGMTGKIIKKAIIMLLPKEMMEL